MRPEEVEKLPKEVYRAGIRPYKSAGKPRKGTIIFGLDTEYRLNEFRETELLTWQLSLDKPMSRISIDELSWESLYKASTELIKESGQRLKDINLIVMAVFFSTAEVQFLDWAKANIQVFGGHKAGYRFKVNSHRSIMIFDLSTWFTNSSLAEVAHSFGLEKLNYDVTALTRESLKDPDFIEYALNDAYITGEILRRLRAEELESSGIDILKSMTPGATASADLRSTYIKKGIYQRHTTLRHKALLAGFGGRVESFYRGQKDLAHQYDFKSFYPHVTVNMKELPLQGDWKSTSDIDKWLASKGGFGKIWFKFPTSVTMPNLPVYGSRTVVYPLEGITHCSSFEAKEAIAQGAEVRLLDGYYYNKGVKWLAEYQHKLISQRAEAEANGDTVKALLAKLKSVAVIGKTAQKHVDFDYSTMLKISRETNIPVNTLLNDCIGFDVQKKLNCGSMFMPEWYTLVLGKARSIIGKLAVEAGAMAILTDSIITEKWLGTEFEYEGIPIRLEASADYVSYRSALYRIGEKLKYHGANKEIAEQVLTKFIDDESVEYVRQGITTLKQALWTGKKLGKVYKQKRRVRLGFDGKRHLYDDGTTRPLKTANNQEDPIELVWSDVTDDDIELVMFKGERQ